MKFVPGFIHVLFCIVAVLTACSSQPTRVATKTVVARITQVIGITVCGDVEFYIFVSADGTTTGYDMRETRGVTLRDDLQAADNITFYRLEVASECGAAPQTT